MHSAEWINLIFFSFFILFVWVRPYSQRQRLIVTALGLVGIFAVIALVFSGPRILRDWVPVGLMVLAYWQPGILYVSQNLKLQSFLQEMDRKILSALPFLKFRSDQPIISAFYEFTELAYLLCYPLVPFGLALFYAADIAELADKFWAVVLPPSYFCYAMVPLTQTLPPRSLPDGVTFGDKPSRIRTLNLWILRNTSIQVNTFPSAHVAASLAIALVVLRYLPVAGFALVFLGITIAIGASAGRYHYITDVIAGALLAILAFAISLLI